MTKRRSIPLLKAREVSKLARRLHTSETTVEIVLKIAGHVLRERYRRRGWLPKKRQEGTNSTPGTERSVVRSAIEIHAPIPEDCPCGQGLCTPQKARMRELGIEPGGHLRPCEAPQFHTVGINEVTA